MESQKRHASSLSLLSFVPRSIKRRSPHPEGASQLPQLLPLAPPPVDSNAGGDLVNFQASRDGSWGAAYRPHVSDAHVASCGSDGSVINICADGRSSSYETSATSIPNARHNSARSIDNRAQTRTGRRFSGRVWMDKYSWAFSTSCSSLAVAWLHGTSTTAPPRSEELEQDSHCVCEVGRPSPWKRRNALGNNVSWRCIRSIRCSEVGPNPSV